MKNKIVLLSAAVIGSIMFGLTGCSKDDTSAPLVTLNGSSVEDVILNSAFTDAGATANDDEDGALAVSVSGSVNVDRAGEYTLTYSATDEAGNVGSATRVVNVYNQAEIFDGNYNNSVDSCSSVTPFNAVVMSSDSINKMVSVGNFGAFDNTNTVLTYIKFSDIVTGSSITMDLPQQVGTTGNAVIDLLYPNDSKVTSGVSASTSFKVKFRWSDGGATDVCTDYFIR